MGVIIGYSGLLWVISGYYGALTYRLTCSKLELLRPSITPLNYF